MKIFLVSNIFPNTSQNERGVFTYRLAMALARLCRVEVIAPLPWVPAPLAGRSGEKYLHAKVPVQEKMGGLPVHHPRYGVIPKILGFMHPIFMFVPLLKRIKQLDRIEQIDLINAHWIFPDGVAAAWVAKKLQKPLVLTGLGCDLNHYPSLPFRKQLIKNALDSANLVTVKGRGLKQTVLQMGIPERKVCVTPNGLDRQHFKILDRNETRCRLGIRGNGPFLLSVGSLDQVKGGEHLIAALKEISDALENPPHLLMVGDGSQRKKLIFQSKHLGIENRVTFVGSRPHDEIPLWMNAADLFCLPSIREGRPNVLIEALACGTPAVASNVGSIPEIIHVENGRIAKTADPKSLAHQILACLKQRWNRKAVRKTAGTFTWDDCAKLYFKAYQHVLNTNNGKGY